MSVDWSEAPEGATHWQPENSKLAAAWFKISEGSRMFKMPKQANWIEYVGPLRDLGEMTPRPVVWTGEGLPPVGTVCEISLKSSIDKHAVDIGRYKCHAGKAVEIVAHHDIGGGCRAAVYAYSNDFAFEYHSLIEGNFRPIRTAEQVAADERLHNIRNALSAIHAGTNFPGDTVRANILLSAVEAMIDAGYRKQPTP